MVLMAANEVKHMAYTWLVAHVKNHTWLTLGLLLYINCGINISVAIN